MALFRTDRLWLAFLAALVPLVILLVYQYAWLRRYERVSNLAYEASIEGALAAVRTEVEQQYRLLGEGLLTFVEADFADPDYPAIRRHWQDRRDAPVSRLFLVDYRSSTYGSFLYFDPETGALEQAFASGEALAVIVACSPFQLMRSRQEGWRSGTLLADERDPAFHILVRPILDEQGQVLGVAGAILDVERFSHELLPTIVGRILPKGDGSPNEGLALRVTDADGGLVFGPEEIEGRTPIREGRFSFVFTDWSLALYNLGPAPLSWDRTDLRFPAVLSGVLALVLLAGVALALQAAKREMRLSQMKADFVSNVSHELKTPVASIRVFADLLRSGKVAAPEKIVEYGTRIEVETRRLSNLIDGVLEFSRMESGQRKFAFVPVDPQELVATTLEAFGRRPVAEGFEIQLQPPEGPTPWVLADREALVQALENLLENAVKYSGEARRVEVRLLERPSRRLGTVLRIEVRDEGIGIDESEQKRIFERFHRVPTHGIHDVKGSGLGLSIVREIVRAHDGSVGVESALGTGSTFVIELPAYRERVSERPSTSVAGEVGQ